MALRYSAVLSMAAVTFALSASSGVIAGPMNLAPPVGAILDLDGQAIPSSPQTYTVDFTATQSSTAITFALREDPAYLSLSNFSQQMLPVAQI